MGAVDDAIGYATDGAEDVERCEDFKAALSFYNGSVPAGVNCVHPLSVAPDGETQDLDKQALKGLERRHA